MPSPFDTRPEIAPPCHATRIYIHCRYHLSTCRRKYANMWYRAESRRRIRVLLVRRLWQRHLRQVRTPLSPHTRSKNSQWTPERCVSPNNPLVSALPSDFRHRLWPRVSHRPSAKRSSRRVIDATVCTFQHMSSVAFRMRAHDKAQ